MKTFITIFILALSTTAFAQDPQLFENEWYLQNVIIDGQDNFPPSNDELSYVPAIFTQDGFFTSVCNELTGFIEYEINSFSFHNLWKLLLLIANFKLTKILKLFTLTTIIVDQGIYIIIL